MKLIKTSMLTLALGVCVGAAVTPASRAQSVPADAQGEDNYNIGVNDDAFLGPWQDDVQRPARVQEPPAPVAAGAGAIGKVPGPAGAPAKAAAASAVAKPADAARPVRAVQPATAEPSPSLRSAGAGSSLGTAARASVAVGAAVGETAAQIAARLIQARSAAAAVPTALPSLPEETEVAAQAESEKVVESAPTMAAATGAGPGVEPAVPVPAPQPLQLAAASQPEEETPEPPLATRRANDYGSSIALSSGNIRDGSFEFGENNGLTESGRFGALDLRVSQRADYDAEAPSYLELSAENIGMDAQSARVEQGVQGRYAVSGAYHQIRRSEGEVSTPYRGIGGNTLSLPSAWTHGGAGAIPELQGSLQPVEITRERERISAQYRHWLSENWQFEGKVEREQKEGLKATGGRIGGFSGVVYPEFLDYTTDTLEAGVNYADRKSQYAIQYSLSRFYDDAEATVYDNPYASGDPATGDQLRGRMGVMPDNTAHQIRLLAGWNTARTRTLADLALTRMEQDEAFLPYTINPNATVTVPLPADSLEGQRDAVRLSVKFDFRPTASTRVHSRYRLDDRESDTPSNLYAYISADSAAVQETTCVDDKTDTAGRDTTCRVNKPFDVRNQRFDVDVTQKLGRDHRLSIGGGLERVDRTDVEVARTDETIVRLGWDGRLGPKWDARVNLEAGDREAESYDAPTEFDDNNADVRKLMFADRERQRARLAVNYLPTLNTHLALISDWIDDQYPDSPLGLQDQRFAAHTLSFSHFVNERLTWTAYATREMFDLAIDGRDPGDCANDPTDTACNWSVADDTETDTVGLEVNWTAIPDKLDFIFGYNLSETEQAVTFDAAPAVSPADADFPVNRSRWYQTLLRANWHVERQLTLSFAYERQRELTNDYSIDGIEADSLAGFPNIIPLVDASPDYRTEIYWLTMKYLF